MFGNTQEISYNSVTKTLVKINQDAFGSEYLLRESTQEFRMRIRHSQTSPKGVGTVYDRHNVELTHVVYGLDGDPDVRQMAYAVFETAPRNQVLHLDLALAGWLDASNLGDLTKWQS